MQRLGMGFVGNALQRANNHRSTPHQLSSVIEGKQKLYSLFKSLDPLVCTRTKQPLWRSETSVSKLIEAGCEPVFLGYEGRSAYFALDVSQNPPTVTEGAFVNLRNAVLHMDQSAGGVLAQARSLLDWHARTCYCGKCGSKTKMTHGGSQRECTNTATGKCGVHLFPRSDPVAIVLAYHKNDCLLTRKSVFAPGVYSLVAGFMEHGETAEEAAARELFEETGISIAKGSHVQYAASQPWPFPASLMLGYYAVAADRQQPIIIDTHELEDAQWFTREQVQEAFNDPSSALLQLPAPYSLSIYMLREWAFNFKV